MCVVVAVCGFLGIVALGCGGIGTPCGVGDRFNMKATITAVPGIAQDAPMTAKADDFSVISVVGTHNISVTQAGGGTTATLHYISVTAEGVASESRTFIDPTKKDVPFFVVVVQWDSGLIKSVTFRDTCDGTACSYSSSAHPCVGAASKMNCAEDITICIQPNQNCDVKIYLYHVGTDKNGVPMTSYDLLPNRYASFSFGDMFNDLR